MNKILLSILIFCLYLNSFGQNSKTNVEIELTPTITSLIGRPHHLSYDPRLRFSTGLAVERFIDTHFSLKSGLIYERKGAISSVLVFDQSNQIIGSTELKVNSDYLTIPILISSQTNGKTKFYINAGSYFSVLVSAKSIASATINSPKKTRDEDKYMKKIDLGFVCGIGVNIPIKDVILLDVGLRNNLGLFNTSKFVPYNGARYSEKTNSFGLQLGIKFKFSGA